MSIKKCLGCLRDLPSTNEYFWKDKKGKLGLSSRCKECYGSKFKKKNVAKEGYKICSKCNKELPRTKEYFYFSGGKITSRCKMCTAEEQKLYTERNKEKVLESKREYRNRPEVKARMKKYLQENKEHIAMTAKEYYDKNKNRIRKLNRIYIETHKEELKEKRRIYMQSEKGKEIFRICNQRRRALKRNTVSTLTKNDWEECLKFFDYKDAYTGLPMDIISQDHVIPLSKGGIHTKRNVVPCELSTNSSKCNDDLEEWYRKQDFFSEERLEKIYTWIGFNTKTNTQQLALF